MLWKGPFVHREPLQRDQPGLGRGPGWAGPRLVKQLFRNELLSANKPHLRAEVIPDVLCVYSGSFNEFAPQSTATSAAKKQLMEAAETGMKAKKAKLHFSQQGYS